MKRIVSLLIAVSMVFGIFSTVFAAAMYSDLTGENIKYAGAVAALSELKVDGQAVINGYPDGTFGPEKTVTRAELAKMLVVCNGIGQVVTPNKMIFSDVPTTHWAAGWINTAAQSKIIVGYPDGTFGPEKTVTYAEAFTMALRALGYGNVADFEGTWPTAYMQKAVELQLNKDMDETGTNIAATRGNIAILLWNMLRRPMWKVTSESENSGMTLSDEKDQLMLETKFPEYTYVEDQYIDYVDVTDTDDVAIGLEDEDGDALGEAQIRNVDLSKLAHGMKITALVKEGKKGEDPVYLTLTSQNEVVEGVITKIDGNKFTVNGVDYKFDENKANMPAEIMAINNYVIFEVDGKKVIVHDGEFVIAELVVGGKEAQDLKAVLREIKEDSVVIKDGEWIDREDIEEGDIYTKVEGHGNPFWMVASVDSRISGSFDAYKSIKDEGITSFFVEVDGDEYRNILGNEMKAYEGEKNNKTVKLADLQAKEKENKYLDQEVEVAFDYLGNPVLLLFGEVSDLNNGGSFYAVANGVWEQSQKGGKVRNISLVGFDGEGASEDEISEGVDYEIKKNADVDGFDQDAILANGTPVFVWANFDDAGETIKTILPVNETLVKSGDPEAYKGKYTILDVGGMKVEDGKVAEYKVTTTPVMVVRPLKDDDDLVEGFAISFKEGLENGDELPAGSYLAYDSSKTVKKAVYVFLAEEAESKVWSFAKVDEYDYEYKNGVTSIPLNGEYCELSDESPIGANGFEKGDIVAYTSYKGKVKIQKVFTTADIDAALVIDDETDPGEDILVFTNGDQFDLEDDSDDMKDYKNHKVVDVEVETKDDAETLAFASCEESNVKGLGGVTNEEGIRVLFSDDEDHKYLLVFHGLKLEEFTEEGKLIDAIEGKEPGEELPSVKEGEPTTPVNPEPETYTVTYEWSGEAVMDLPDPETVEEGAAWNPVALSLDGYTFAYEPESVDAVNASFTCYVTAIPDGPEPPVEFTVTYEWSGDPAEGVDLPEDEVVEAGALWEAYQLEADAYIFEYQPAMVESVEESFTCYITATAAQVPAQPEVYTITYLWAEDTDFSGDDLLPEPEEVQEGSDWAYDGDLEFDFGAEGSGDIIVEPSTLENVSQNEEVVIGYYLH